MAIRGIRLYTEREMAGNLTLQELSVKTGLEPRIIRRSLEPTDMHVLDFITIMNALGRNSVFALRELATELEKCAAEPE